MKKLLYLSVILSAMFFSASCQREGAIFEVPADCALLSFPSEDAIIQMTKEDGNKFAIELWRGNTKGAISVPVSIKYDVEGIFTAAKNSIEFADGEAVATLVFNYDDINAFGGESYSIEVSIDDENQVSPSGISSVSLAVSRKLTYVLLGEGEYYSDYAEESWDQEIYTTVEAPDYYILPDCWVKGCDFTFTVKNGQPVFPDMWDSGYYYSPYGNVFIYKTGVEYKDGVISIGVGYSIPAIEYDFGSGYIEYYKLPEGVVLK